MHIQQADTIFFTGVLQTLPTEIEFGEIEFYHQKGIPNSSLTYSRREGLYRRDFSLDPLVGLAAEAEALRDFRLQTISVKFGPPEYASRDYHDLIGRNGMLEVLLRQDYQIRRAQFQIPLETPSTREVMKAAQLSLRCGALKSPGFQLTIPEEKSDTESARRLCSWYEELERKR